MNTLSSCRLRPALVAIAALLPVVPATAQGAPTITVRTALTAPLSEVEARARIGAGVFDSIPADTDVSGGFALFATEPTATASLTCTVQQVPFRLHIQHTDTLPDSSAFLAKSRARLVVTIRSNHPITGVLRLTRQRTGTPFSLTGSLIFEGRIHASWNHQTPATSQQYDIPFAVNGSLEMEVSSFCWAIDIYGSATESYLLEILSTQPAYDPNFSAGCLGSNGIPSFLPAAGETPALNDVFTCDVANLPSGQLAFGLLGFMPIVSDLGNSGAPNCVMHTDVAMLDVLTHAGGVGTWSVFIPNEPGLFGLAFYQQVMALDPGTNPLGVVVSNCGMGVFGI